jgi:hypothetical protein
MAGIPAVKTIPDLRNVRRDEEKEFFMMKLLNHFKFIAKIQNIIFQSPEKQNFIYKSIHNG